MFDAENGARLIVTNSFERVTVTSQMFCARADEQAQLQMSDSIDAVASVDYFFNRFVQWCDWRARRLRSWPSSDVYSRRMTQESDSVVFRTMRGDWLQIDSLFDPHHVETDSGSEQLQVWSACATSSSTPWRWPREMYSNSSSAHVLDLFLDVVLPQCMAVVDLNGF